LHGFSGHLGLKWELGGKMGERVVRWWPQRIRFYFWGFLRLCQFWWESIKKCHRESAHRWIHWYTDANRFYNLSHAICYNDFLFNVYKGFINVTFFTFIRQFFCLFWTHFTPTPRRRLCKVYS